MGYRVVTGLTKGVTQLLSALNLTEVRYLPFYTYDLTFEALVDTLQRLQHIVIKILMFWLKFQGDAETDKYRYQQSKYFDKVVTTLWSAIEVADRKDCTEGPTKGPREEAWQRWLWQRRQGWQGKAKGQEDSALLALQNWQVQDLVCR